MANDKHLNILQQGVDVWNTWREEHPNVEPGFGRGHHFGADLSEADFRRIQLVGVDLL